MTELPKKTNKKLGLVIDLDICVGCHACAVSCKEWNTSGHSSPLHDVEPYGDDPTGVWFNRIHTFEVETEVRGSKTVHFPKSCLHCDDAPCVTVCPTGASYKRDEDGIVLVNAETCIGCKLCSWACPYGAREYDETAGVMKKCTLCVDKIYNENLPENELSIVESNKYAMVLLDNEISIVLLYGNYDSNCRHVFTKSCLPDLGNSTIYGRELSTGMNVAIFPSNF